MLGTVAALAARVGGRVVGDGAVSVARVAAVGDATADALTFATDERYLAAALASPAAAVLLDAALSPNDPPSKPLILVENVRHALATLLDSLRSPRPRGPFRHPSAVIASDAQVAADAYVGAGAYVGTGARVGAGSVLDVGTYVGGETTIGAQCWLQPRATVLERCTLGDRVVLHAGCVIGSEGFGWAFLDGLLERIPQIGNVVLEDDVEIGANTCIDRAQTGSTVIGAGAKIDNLCQIGHNCRIGKHTVMAGMCGLAGTTVIGDFCQIGGRAMFRDHVTVGSHVTIAGGSEIWSDIPGGITISGSPAREHRQRLREEVQIRKLPKLLARVDALERELSRRDE